MKTVMKETGEWRKKYTEAIKKKDKQLIEELKKKQSQMQKMSMEMQQQQMRPMMLYMIPSFMLWIFVFPAIFGQTVALIAHCNTLFNLFSRKCENRYTCSNYK